MLKTSDVSIVSLDLETGGLQPGKHTPLSIGAVVVSNIGDLSDGTSGDKPTTTDKNSFYIQLEWDTVVVDPKALRINGLDIADPPGPDGVISNRSLPASQGLSLFCEWISSYCTGSVHALGVNVGSFDLQMLRSIWDYGLLRRWPFHYRSIDLNSLFFALSKIQNKPFDTIKREITEIAWDKSEFSVEMAHNALADAWSNVYMWKECLRRFDGNCGISC